MSSTIGLQADLCENTCKCYVDAKNDNNIEVNGDMLTKGDFLLVTFDRSNSHRLSFYKNYEITKSFSSILFIGFQNIYL